MLRILLSIAATLCLLVSQAMAGEVLWLGQATTKITTNSGKVIVIDPFLKKNPKTPEAYKDLSKLGPVDLILVTHGHFDHTADVAELAKMTGAKVVGNGALPHQMTAYGMIEKGQGISMNKSGIITPIGPDIKIHMVPAEHSSSLRVKHPETGNQQIVYSGQPVGYVVELEDGFKIYHSGDTGIFGDMAIIGHMLKPDIAMIAIGGHFTMNPDQAAYAMKNWVKPAKIIPIHYGTFPPLKGTPDELKAALGGAIEVLDVMPGDAVKF